MREYIWEYALAEKGIIWLYFDNERLPAEARFEPYKEPGLMSTCRQIRNEALPIYYKLNKFVAQAKDKLVPKVIELEKKCRAMGVSDAMKMSVCPVNAPVWARTLQWCEHVHGGGKWYPNEKTMRKEKVNEIFYRAALQMTNDLENVEWKTCKRALDLLKSTQVELDGAAWILS